MLLRLLKLMFLGLASLRFFPAPPRSAYVSSNDNHGTPLASSMAASDDPRHCDWPVSRGDPSSLGSGKKSWVLHNKGQNSKHPRFGRVKGRRERREEGKREKKLQLLRVLLFRQHSAVVVLHYAREVPLLLIHYTPHRPLVKLERAGGQCVGKKQVVEAALFVRSPRTAVHTQRKLRRGLRQELRGEFVHGVCGACGCLWGSHARWYTQRGMLQERNVRTSMCDNHWFLPRSSCSPLSLKQGTAVCST